MAYRLAVITLVLIASVACRQPIPDASIEPPSLPVATASPETTEPEPTKFVETEVEAIDIAVNAWIPIFGREKIEDDKPYRAILKKGIWNVEGSLPEGWVGGVPRAQIRQKDGKVIAVWHDK